MTISRRQQICLAQTCYYHCISRCVRRAFLCGFDTQSGNSYQHRRGWVEQRLLAQSQAFCIDLVGYAIMSNHYHVIVRVNPKLAASLSAEEVLARWQQLYRLNPLMARFVAGESLSVKEQEAVHTEIERMRQTLMSISRFMGYLNERIARQANAEDGCKGRFWEGRFKSQALLDETALLQCLAYVELNPVRAGLSRAPTQSDYTSVKHRLEQTTPGLLPFQSSGPEATTNHPNPLPFRFEDYLQLLDWSGRILLADKDGAIRQECPTLIDQLGITPVHWQTAMKPPVPWHQKALGSVAHIKEYCQAIGQRWLRQTSSSLNYT